MAPQRSQKRKNTASSLSDSLVQTSAAPARVSVRELNTSPFKTPPRSPVQRTIRITKAQKEALIENLQLEITERARKLRAQYALQAQALKTRLEIRVHRIPAALRKTTISELIERYAEQCAGHNAKPTLTTSASKSSTIVEKSRLPRSSPAKGLDRPLPGLPSVTAGSPPAARGTKRTSAEMTLEADKENARATIANPKKRARTGVPQSQPSTSTATRPTSRLAVPAQVLSPRSANSRNLPSAYLSPSKEKNSIYTSPAKSLVARPMSPLKPSLTIAIPTAASIAKSSAPKSSGKTATASSARSTSAAARKPPLSGSEKPSKKGKRGAAVAAAAPVVPPHMTSTDNAADIDDGRTSVMSDASAGTTVVAKARQKRTDVVTSTSAAPALTHVPSTASSKTKKGGLVSKLAGLGAKGRKVAAAASAKVEKEAVAAGGSVKVGRVLRKRG